MKKILVVLSLIVLAGCAAETPSSIRPYINGPIYYKQPSCITYQAFPKQVKRWNYNIGMEETYYTNENTLKTICNYNPYMNPQNLNDAVYR